MFLKKFRLDSIHKPLLHRMDLFLQYIVLIFNRRDRYGIEFVFFTFYKGIYINSGSGRRFFNYFKAKTSIIHFIFGLPPTL
jgi:hypothetical protein